MRYRADIDANALIWKVGDKPDVRGVITANAAIPTLLGVTVRLYAPSGVIVTERVADYTLATGAFKLILPAILTERKEGLVYVSALEDSTYTRTLTAEISASASSAELTGSTGTLPAAGFCLIESEWCQYTLSGTTLTFVTRGLFNTTAAVHGISTTVKFASCKETCTPDYPFTVRDVMELWTPI